MEIEISIIIVNYNSSEYTKKCIQSIFTYENKSNYEILIVDNKSNEINRKILEDSEVLKDKRVEIIFSEDNNGFGIGNNLAAQKAKGEYLLLLNTDTILNSDILEFCLSKFKEEKKLGILGLQLLYFDGSLQASYGYFPKLKQEIFELFPLSFKKNFEKITNPLALSLSENEFSKDVDYVSGAFIVIKNSVYKKVNGFDPRFFMYFEETDLCKRVKDLGFQNVIYNNKVIMHKGGGSIGAFSVNKANMFIESKFKYLKFHNIDSFFIKNAIKFNALFKENFYKIKLRANKEDKLLIDKVVYWKIIGEKCK